MNIFVLDKNPVHAARMQCDKHVVKMVLETAQLLCSPFEPGMAPYKRTHYNHPCAKWARQSLQNWHWLTAHGLSLAEEYSHRYGKRHKSEEVILWCINHAYMLGLPDIDMTPFPQAMPDEYKGRNTVKAYREYYKGDKSSFAKWTKRNAPKWFEPG